MANHLEPHSDEWFARMRKINPRQADMTAQYIQLSGTPQCCGICGDTDNIADYKLVSDPMMTIRICGDCKQIQKAQGGLSVDPIDG